MGDVKETVKGSAPPKRKVSSEDGQNLINRTQALMDDVSDCIVSKDDDVLNEGDSAKAENTRKAALLRASHSLLRSVKAMLEDY